MKTSFSSEKEFIKAVAPAAQKACKRYGYLPSVLIAQACHENGYGIPSYWDNSGIKYLLLYNNMVGQKSELLTKSWADKSVWPGKSFNKTTPEQYSGKMVTIKDNFRIFDDIEQSFCDFILFLLYASNYGYGGTPKYGADVVNIKNPETLIKTVAGRGYATGSTYPSAVMKIINKHNLTQYDDLTKVVASNYIPDSLKSKYSSTNNTSSISNIKKLQKKTINDITGRNRSQVPASRGNNSIKFIVCHYLGVPNADNPDLYGGGYGGHYNIQRNGQIFLAANPRTAVVWHCGGGLQGSGGHSYYQICTNYNSIGIECGVCYTENVKDASGDSNKWYFTEETQESLVYLVSKLMDEYNIPINHVIRHYDVTGKICPNPYVKNNGLRESWTWNQFIENVKQYRKDGTITIPSKNSSNKTMATTQNTTRNYLQKGDSGSAVKTMQKMLITCGYSCGSAGADGDFGNATLTALKSFQKNQKLTVDGLYGEKSKFALTTLYKAKKASVNASSSTQTAIDTFLNSVKNVANMAKSGGWVYGDSHAIPPCSDKIISCDRIIARALYDLGYTDQPQGGITCGNIATYLPKWGWTKVTNKKDIKPGAVVAVGPAAGIRHVFVVQSYNPTTDLCNKYDTGSNARIRSGAYFTNVKLVEWADRKFIAAWNVPSTLKGATTSSTSSKKLMFNNLDYSPVYNYTYYKNNYEDLRKAFGNNESAYFKHFCTYGMKEGRQAIATFNVQKYQSYYTDLRKAFGNDLPAYYKHYIQYGKKEGRKTT